MLLEGVLLRRICPRATPHSFSPQGSGTGCRGDTIAASGRSPYDAFNAAGNAILSLCLSKACLTSNMQ
jgi:hypothetical protein